MPTAICHAYHRPAGSLDDHIQQTWKSVSAAISAPIRRMVNPANYILMYFRAVIMRETQQTCNCRKSYCVPSLMTGLQVRTSVAAFDHTMAGLIGIDNKSCACGKSVSAIAQFRYSLQDSDQEDESAREAEYDNDEDSYLDEDFLDDDEREDHLNGHSFDDDAFDDFDILERDLDIDNEIDEEEEELDEDEDDEDFDDEEDDYDEDDDDDDEDDEDFDLDYDDFDDDYDDYDEDDYDDYDDEDDRWN